MGGAIGWLIRHSSMLACQPGLMNGAAAQSLPARSEHCNTTRVWNDGGTALYHGAGGAI
jgi:hypothetical protein